MKKRRKPLVFPGPCSVPINRKEKGCGGGCTVGINQTLAWSKSFKRPPVAYTKACFEILRVLKAIKGPFSRYSMEAQDAANFPTDSFDVDSPLNLAPSSHVVKYDFRNDSGLSSSEIYYRNLPSQKGSISYAAAPQKQYVSYRSEYSSSAPISNDQPAHKEITSQVPMGLSAKEYSKYWAKPAQSNYMPDGRPASNRPPPLQQADNSLMPISQVYAKDQQWANHKQRIPKQKLYIRKWDAIPPMCCSRLEPQLQNGDRRQLNVIENQLVVNTMPYRGTNTRIAQGSRQPMTTLASQTPTPFRDQRSNEEKKPARPSTGAVSYSWAKSQANPPNQENKQQRESLSRSYATPIRGYDVDKGLEQHNAEAPQTYAHSSLKRVVMTQYENPPIPQSVANSDPGPQNRAEIRKARPQPIQKNRKKIRPDFIPSERTGYQMPVTETRQEIDDRRRNRRTKELVENVGDTMDVIGSCMPSKARRRKPKKGRRKKFSRRKKGDSGSRRE